jgi:hypothetical protein
MTTAEDARVMIEICTAILTRAEMSEVGLAAMNYPEALTRALSVHAGETFDFEEFARLMLRIARDVNQRKGVVS